MVDRIVTRRGSAVFDEERPISDRRFPDIGKRTGQADQSRMKRLDEIGEPHRRGGSVLGNDKLGARGAQLGLERGDQARERFRPRVSRDDDG